MVKKRRIIDAETAISLSEIAYKSGQIRRAITHARAGLAAEITLGQRIALRIFIARAHSKLGQYDRSNAIYRELLCENVYLPPVIMGLIYNNFHNKKKTHSNLGLMKIFVR